MFSVIFISRDERAPVYCHGVSMVSRASRVDSEASCIIYVDGTLALIGGLSPREATYCSIRGWSLFVWEIVEKKKGKKWFI